MDLGLKLSFKNSSFCFKTDLIILFRQRSPRLYNSDFREVIGGAAEEIIKCHSTRRIEWRGFGVYKTHTLFFLDFNQPPQARREHRRLVVVQITKRQNYLQNGQPVLGTRFFISVKFLFRTFYVIAVFKGHLFSTTNFNGTYERYL